MANMSYCRFENTSSDLEDCIFAMEEAETLKDMDLSSHEKRAMKRMANLCSEFLQHMERFEETTVETDD